MKAISIAFALCAALFCSTAARAETAPKWSDAPVTIQYIETAVGGWAWVKVSAPVGIDKVCSDGKGDYSNAVLLSPTRGNADGRDRDYKSLMAAFLAGKQVLFRLVSSTDVSGHCEIERFRIIN